MATEVAPRAPFRAAPLRVHNLGYSYGALPALRNVTIEVPAGTVCAVLGTNGAGKSTLASAIAGVVTTGPGSVMLDGEDLSQTPRFARARRGVSFVPEGGALFPALTVAENILVGDRGASRQQRKETLERAAELFPFMGKRWNERAGMLSGGEQQMVSLSRTLVHPSTVVVVDELSHGLAPAIVEQLFGVLAGFRGEMTLVLIEQYVKRAHELADQVVVLSYGTVALQRAAAEVTLAEIEQAYELDLAESAAAPRAMGEPSLP
ncbi:MAG: ATP-binding cassette domain-containing protein [Alphaproteobacteria bacterium]